MTTRTRLWDIPDYALLWDSDRDPGTAEEFARTHGSVCCTIDKEGDVRWSGRLEVTEEGSVERNWDYEYLQYMVTMPNPLLAPAGSTAEEMEQQRRKAGMCCGPQNYVDAIAEGRTPAVPFTEDTSPWTVRQIPDRRITEAGRADR